MKKLIILLLLFFTTLVVAQSKIEIKDNSFLFEGTQYTIKHAEDDSILDDGRHFIFCYSKNDTHIFITDKDYNIKNIYSFSRMKWINY